MTNNSVKPICVVYYNPEALFISEPAPTIYEVNETFKSMFPDYYVLCVPSYKSVEGEAEIIELKVFYQKDFTDIEYNNLKKLIEQEFKKN